MSVEPGANQSAEANVAPEEANIPRKGSAALPIELIAIIGEFLAGSHCRKSLASFSVTNHQIHEEVLPILYETLVWDTEVARWILQSGHIAGGWRWTKYLVTMDDSFTRILHYLQAIKKRDFDDLGFGLDSALNEIFPKLAVVFTKTWDETESYPDDIFKVEATLYKPVNMNILLEASTTSSTVTTTFFGATVRDIVPREDPQCFERLLKLSIQSMTHVRKSQKAFVFPNDTDIAHNWAEDYHLFLHVANDFPGHPEVLIRQLPPVKETLEALLSAIPVRKEISALCQLEISCNKHEFKLLCETIVPSLKEHVGILVSLRPPESYHPFPRLNFPSFDLLQKPVAALAEKYVAAWGKLGPIKAGQDFFRVQFTNHDEPVYPDSDEEEDEDEDEDEDRYRRRKYMNIVCLTTPPVTDATLPDQPPQAFDMVVKRIEHNADDGDDYYDVDAAIVLSSKRYPV